MSKKPLFPVTYGIPEIHTGLVQYHICSNGLFMTKRVAGKGTITVKIDGIPGLEEGKESVSVLPRKIPMAYFWKIVEFFKGVEKHFNEGLEAYVLLCYCYDTDKYFLWVPPHTVSVASVRYDISSFPKLYPNSYILLDCHSHGSKISGYFSGTDNKDDNRERFSMVIGKIDKVIPECKIRFSSMGKFYDYELDDIFSTDGKIDCTFDIQDGIEQIKLVDVTTDYCSGSVNRGYSTGYRGRSLYESIRYQVVDRQMSMKEIMGEDW